MTKQSIPYQQKSNTAVLYRNYWQLLKIVSKQLSIVQFSHVGDLTTFYDNLQ